MPVMKMYANDSEGEEMDQETPDSEKSSNEESDCSEGSEDDDSSEMDEVECERRRTECLFDMQDLEKQFSLLKEQLYHERLTQVNYKLADVKTGSALEYTKPLLQLHDNMRIRISVAGVLRRLKVDNIKTKFEAEELACRQNYHSEKMILKDTLQSELEEKIRRLEEDRNSIDITSDLRNEQASHKRNKKKADPMNPDKRKKPVTVSGPYIVYMLQENDILEDWTSIKKALKATKRKTEHCYRTEDNNRFNARFTDGKLFYEGESFCKGHHVILENLDDSPLLANIVSLNTSEVVLKRLDGNRLKLSITDLQAGKYSIRHSVA